MSQCNPRVLFENGDTNISTCVSCKRIGLHYKNILCAFDRTDFEGFSNCLSRIDFHNESVCFPNREMQLVVKTCHTDIQFCFGEAEFEEFKLALEEALLMLEVHKALEV